MQASKLLKQIIERNWIEPGTGNSVGLGDGIMAYQTADNPESHTWEIYPRPYKDQWSRQYKIGWLSLYYYPEHDRWTINNIALDDRWRGKGIGRRLLSKLHELYPRLGSDPQGVTSDAAVKMWKALGAKQSKAASNVNSKGYFYTLGEGKRQA